MLIEKTHQFGEFKKAVSNIWNAMTIKSLDANVLLERIIYWDKYLEWIQLKYGIFFHAVFTGFENFNRWSRMSKNEWWK